MRPAGARHRPAPEPTTEPVFASDEEALAAATDAYKAYLAMSDLIAQEGGKDPERIAPFVTEEWLQGELSGYEALRNSNRRTVGVSSFANARLQQHHQEPDGSLYVVIYVCSDETGIRVLDSTNADVTPLELSTIWPAEVVLTSSTHDDGKLLVSGEELWERDAGCRE